VSDIQLAEGFDPVDWWAWEAAVKDALGGKDAKSLVRSVGGVSARPLYVRGDDDHGAPALPMRTGPWGVRVRVMHPDPVAANRLALDELHRGADQVAFRLDVATRSGRGDDDLRAVDGTAVAGVDDVRGLVDGILLDLATVALDAGAAFAAAGHALLDEAAARGQQASARLSLGADPVGTLATLSALPQGLDAATADFVELVRRAAEFGPDVRAASVTTAAHHLAGGDEVDDLALLVARGVDVLRTLTDHGVDLDVALGQLEFRVPVGVDQFLAIAKLRALRWMWWRVTEAAGAAPADRVAHVHADVAEVSMTARDPWVNMLRGTIACFAAGVGGADSVTVLPFDARAVDARSGGAAVPGSLGRRIARNTQLVLQRESRLDHVTDPAAGSWYVESLTTQLAMEAWRRFQEVEAAGGALAALQAGLPQDWATASRERRDAQVATRRQAVTGVSEFANVAEESVQGEAVDRPAIAAAAVARAPDQEPLVAKVGTATEVAPFPIAPIAGAFEALRDAADAAAAAKGDHPRILLANIGPAVRHNARATFARNAFEAGGIRAVGEGGHDTAVEVVAALKRHRAVLAVVCGDDDQYASHARAFAGALKVAGAEQVWLAGRPDTLWADADQHLDGYVHAGADLLAVLRSAHAALGLAQEVSA